MERVSPADLILHLLLACVERPAARLCPQSRQARGDPSFDVRTLSKGKERRVVLGIAFPKPLNLFLL